MTRKEGKTKDFRFCDADWEPAQRQVQHGRWRQENYPPQYTTYLQQNPCSHNEIQGRVLCVFILGPATYELKHFGLLKQYYRPLRSWSALKFFFTENGYNYN